jgi:hypothetical protein
MRYVKSNPMFAILACSLIVLTALPVQAGVTEKITKSFGVSPGGTLYLDSEFGSIEVVSGDNRKVEVEVVIEAKRGGSGAIKDFRDRVNFDFQKEGNDVRVTGEKKNRRLSSNLWRSVKVTYQISVPRQYNLDLKTAGGSIWVDDLEGDVVSRTSGGSLKFGTIKGSVNGKTSGGSIKLENCEGPVDAHTSGGSITIGNVKGEVNATTSGGSINVEEVMGAIQASTSGGSVKASISRQPENDCRLTTSGGTITVYLARDIRMNLDASTSGGRVRTSFPVTVQGELSSRKLRAELNGGGPELYLRTSGGSIHINEL